jgi:hypothetical protein
VVRQRCYTALAVSAHLLRCFPTVCRRTSDLNLGNFVNPANAILDATATEYVEVSPYTEVENTWSVLTFMLCSFSVHCSTNPQRRQMICLGAFGASRTTCYAWSCR